MLPIILSFIISLVLASLLLSYLYTRYVRKVGKTLQKDFPHLDIKKTGLIRSTLLYVIPTYTTLQILMFIAIGFMDISSDYGRGMNIITIVIISAIAFFNTKYRLIQIGCTKEIANNKARTIVTYTIASFFFLGIMLNAFLVAMIPAILGLLFS